MKLTTFLLRTSLFMEHHLVPFASLEWISGWFTLASIGIFALVFLPKLEVRTQRNVERVWAFALLVSTAIEHLYMFSAGTWSTEWSLPLQMCSLSGLLAVYTLLTHNKTTYIFLLFWGVSGGLHSLLTPEMTLGSHAIYSITYYFWHASIIMVPIYFFKARRFGLSKRSFFKVWGWTHAVWIVVGLFDWGVGANYMYILEPPKVDNPFVMGGFPYHLIGFEFAGILHFGLTALIFGSLSRRFNHNASSEKVLT
ncbi:TIGR02206 family membrane protein [Phaeocystidibacter marisrubri]|uniref:TIGR02206 family membrane protein n=2 Tax=Phaeocystidibacter marisrubri TaxID=1577780 RepID=A0A6L3ZFR1_9FLAO|nr:TIGR02206 family membrane protein [Phaeocystidibacter marisrubri]